MLFALGNRGVGETVVRGELFGDDRYWEGVCVYW